MDDSKKWREYKFDDIARVGSGLALISIFYKGKLVPIGSGFVVSASGESATILTAAHNLTYIRSRQNPDPSSHRSALPEFLPPKPDLDLSQIMIACYEGNDIERAVITEVLYEENSDFAWIQVITQTKGLNFFKTEYPLNESEISIGDEVFALGRAHISMHGETWDGTRGTARMIFHIIARSGYVTAIHPEGHLLCRGPCVETSIPVFGGM